MAVDRATRSVSVRGRELDVVIVAAAALVLLVPLVEVVSALRHPWIPASDWALIELHVRDVGGRHTPLVGAYSRFGWRHPGPWAFYLMAPFYRLAPADRGLAFGAAMVNLAMVAAYVAVVVRFGRTQALVALLGLAVLLRGLGAGFVADPWNPNMAILPLALLMVLGIEIVAGNRTWAGPAAVAAGALAVQSHLGLLPPVAMVSVVTVVLAWRLRAAPCPSRRVWAATGAVALVAWLPPLLDQAFGSGNLWKLIRWSTGHDINRVSTLEEGRFGPIAVRQRTAWLLDPFGMWLGRVDTPRSGMHHLLGAYLSWHLLVIVGMLVGAWLLARLATRWGGGVGREDRVVRAACALAAAGAVGVYLGVKGLRGAPFLWGLRWSAVVVMLLWLALVSAVALVLARRWPAASPGVQSLALAGVVVAVAWTLGWGTVAAQPFPDESALWLDFRPKLLAAMRDDIEADGLIVIQPAPFVYGDQNDTFEVVLERAGVRWVDGNDPDAHGLPHYYVIRSGPDGSGFEDWPSVVARSKVPPRDALRVGRVILVRQEPTSLVSSLLGVVRAVGGLGYLVSRR